MTNIFVYTLIPVCVIFGTWVLTSTVFPALENPNGVALLVGGIVLAFLDLLMRHTKNEGGLRPIFISDAPLPTIYGIPFWLIAGVIIWGGVAVLHGKR